VDADNYTSQAIEALIAMNCSRHVDVVIGAQHHYREQIQNACIANGYVCHEQTNRMAELMAEADFAIGAGGSASWERCCLGLPALLVALAENQIDIAKALDSIGACIYLGTKETANLSTLQKAITNLLTAHDQLGSTSRHAFSLVDGMGVSRVCQILGC
jgi:UDP-2,4-diacetamido-2,4,6-trideoxy-beta-L-altropyranose hydrolase